MAEENVVAEVGQSHWSKSKNSPRGSEKAFIEVQMKKAYPQSDTPSADPPPVDEPTKNVLTTTQWLSVISIVVSLAGIYYKREEIKGMFAKPTPAPPNSPVDFAPKRGGIKPMD